MIKLTNFYQLIIRIKLKITILSGKKIILNLE